MSSVAGKNGTLSIEVKYLFLKYRILGFLVNISRFFFFSFWWLSLSSVMSIGKFGNDGEKYLRIYFSSCFWMYLLRNIVLNICIHSLNTQVPKPIRKVHSLFRTVIFSGCLPQSAFRPMTSLWIFSFVWTCHYFLSKLVILKSFLMQLS